MKYIKKKETKQADWRARLIKETVITDKDLKKLFLIDWSWEKMQHIFRSVWWDIFKYAQDNHLTLRNIVAITGKDTRKTTVFIIFLWFLMVEYPWLNGYILRDTIVKSKTQMKQHLNNAIKFITNEYGVTNFSKKILQATDGFYLVRDKKSKTNQKIELLSFDSIIEIGGFITNNGYPAIFIYDELQNPRSSFRSIINSKQFIANYKLIDDKNEVIEMATNKFLPPWIPRHYFLSNRYVASHPLNLFAEEHLPYYDFEKDGKIITGVRTWMLDNPLQNNFIAKYFGKDDMKPGWEDFWGTMVIYGSKLSNEIFRKNKVWEAKQMTQIERGHEDDLARVIGDLFEGYDDNSQCYHYTRQDKITEEEFQNNYAPYVNEIRIAIDVDFSRQIIIGAHYDAKRNFYNETGQFSIFRTFRDKKIKIKCFGLTIDGARTEGYLQQIYRQLIIYCARIKKLMPHITKVRIIFDDKQTLIVSAFNFGKFQNSFWSAVKVSFDRSWPIKKRPSLTDKMQDAGFVIDIQHPSLVEFHHITKSAKIKETSEKSSNSRQRLEKSGDAGIDILNQDEYGLYGARVKLIITIANETKLESLGVDNEW